MTCRKRIRRCQNRGWPFLWDQLGGCTETAQAASGMEAARSSTRRENLAGDAKGKSTSGSNREAESTDAPERGGLPRSSDEVGQCPWSEGGGSSSLSAGQPGQTGRSPTVQRKAAAFAR